MASSSKRTHEFTSPSRRPAATSVKSEEHIDDVDANMLRRDVLIPRSRDSSRQPGLPSVTHYHHSSTPTVVIPPHQQNIYTYPNGRDVPPTLNNVARPPANPTTTSYPHQHVRSQPEHVPFSNTHHASLNTPADRPRTQLPVFGTTSELAAHYGIPARLPPTPSVNNPTSTKPSAPTFDYPENPSATTSSTVDNEQLADFQYHLVASYINMVSTNPQEPAEAASAMAVPPVQPTPDVSAVDNMVVPSTVMDMLAVATPGLGWDEFLTSPFDDSPIADFDVLETPANGAASLGDDFYTSPLVADLNSYDPSYADMPLFTDDYAKATANSMPPPPTPPTTSLAAQFDNLFTMSPLTPAIDASPLPTDLHTFPPTSAPSKTNKKGPTGTRKNISPESLVPLDAPTQPRNYLAPSSTSRKELPAVFAKKRARSTAFGDEEDELEGEDAGPPTGTEADAIAAKRRQNTLAARRSRKRKLEYQRDLENTVEAERQEKEMWRGKALFYEAHMQAMGCPVPQYTTLS